LSVIHISFAAGRCRPGVVRRAKLARTRCQARRFVDQQRGHVRLALANGDRQAVSGLST
jgi:hypothetical protein